MPEEYDLANLSAPHQLSHQASQSFPRQEWHEGVSHETGSVREAEYKGHRIRIETTYHITVDDEPVTGHLTVGNDGRVHYHAIPNQEFDSVVDMVKRVIDLTPPDFWPAHPRTHHHDHDDPATGR